MEIDSSKFRPHDILEQSWQHMVISVARQAVKDGMPLTHLRFGRQMKSHGSTGVNDIHVYRYKTDPTKRELWVNAKRFPTKEMIEERLAHYMTGKSHDWFFAGLEN